MFFLNMYIIYIVLYFVYNKDMRPNAKLISQTYNLVERILNDNETTR